MGTTYLVRKNADSAVYSLLRVCDDGAVEYLAGSTWLPEPNAFYVIIGEIGDEVTAEEAEAIARGMGGDLSTRPPPQS